MIFYNYVKLTEKRWCPFKYIKKLEYDRDYYYLRSDEQKNLYIAGKLLRTYGIVNCNDISVHEQMQLINESSDIIKTTVPTIFDDYYKLLERKYL